MGSYPYPNFVTYASKSNDEIYAITKAMIDGYDAFKDGAPGALGLSVKRQTMKWVLPFHPGAVKALEEADNWTDADQAHNDGLIKRQGVLAAAWADYAKSSPASRRRGVPVGMDGGARHRACKRPICRTVSTSSITAIAGSIASANYWNR